MMDPYNILNATCNGSNDGINGNGKIRERRSSNSSVATEDSGYSSIFRTVNSIRVYNSQNEYLVAMIEDLSVWLEKNHSISVNVDNFFEVLESGVVLCRQAVMVFHAGEDYLLKEADEKTKSTRVLPKKFSNCLLKLPTYPPQFREAKSPDLKNSGAVSQPAALVQKFWARDAVANFIGWLRQFGFSDSVLFETEDLMSRKNVRNVVLTLLELARVGGVFGLSIPNLVELEQEIDAEMLADNSSVTYNNFNNNTGDSLINEKIGRRRRSGSTVSTNSNSTKAESKAIETAKIPRFRRGSVINSSEIEKLTIPFNKNVIKPKPYSAVCDIKSLDELVREILMECQCEKVFPMTRLAEGKYLFGDKDLLIYVRVLRNHVMVRVGGGWDTLNNLLDKSDPCRKNGASKSKQINYPVTSVSKEAFIPIQKTPVMNGFCTLPRSNKSSRRFSLQTPPCKEDIQKLTQNLSNLGIPKSFDKNSSNKNRVKKAIAHKYSVPRYRGSKIPVFVQFTTTNTTINQKSKKKLSLTNRSRKKPI